MWTVTKSDFNWTDNARHNYWMGSKEKVVIIPSNPNLFIVFTLSAFSLFSVIRPGKMRVFSWVQSSYSMSPILLYILLYSMSPILVTDHHDSRANKTSPWQDTQAFNFRAGCHSSASTTIETHWNQVFVVSSRTMVFVGFYILWKFL